MQLFQKCFVVSRHRGEPARLILEAAKIESLDDKFVIMPSLALSKKDLSFFFMRYGSHMASLLSPVYDVHARVEDWASW